MCSNAGCVLTSTNSNVTKLTPSFSPAINTDNNCNCTQKMFAPLTAEPINNIKQSNQCDCEKNNNIKCLECDNKNLNTQNGCVMHSQPNNIVENNNEANIAFNSNQMPPNYLKFIRRLK